MTAELQIRLTLSACRFAYGGAIPGRLLKAFIFVGLLLITPLSAGAEVGVQISGRIEKIGSFERNRVHYFSFSEFVELYGERLSWDILAQSIDYQVGKNRFRFYLGSPFISLNDTALNMVYPARIKNGSLYLPTQTFLPALDRARSERISWESDRNRIRVESGLYNITDISSSKKANGLLIDIYLTEELTFEVTESEGNWLNFSFPGGRVDIPKIESRQSLREIREINAFQFTNSAQVSLRLRKPPQSYTARYDPNSRRVRLSLRNPNYKPEATHRPIGHIGPDSRINLIVIDPGHGGSDNGAIGQKYTKEKDICLKVAQELAKLIRKDKLFKVLLTRNKDETVSLQKRAAIANDAEADLFISIHINASLSKQACGSQVFFLAPAKNDSARALAQAENASFLTSGSSINLNPADELSMIVNDMIQKVYMETSADLSEIIQSEFRRSLKIPSRGVDQAGFVVLNEVYMPSVLVEVAFISNAREEKLLRDKSFRKKVAKAIYAGLKRFKRKYEQTR